MRDSSNKKGVPGFARAAVSDPAIAEYLQHVTAGVEAPGLLPAIGCHLNE
jgi:hypothetical protein